MRRRLYLPAWTRHGCWRVNVHLEQAEGKISLRIKDDGMGFDPNRVDPGHMGL